MPVAGENPPYGGLFGDAGAGTFGAMQIPLAIVTRVRSSFAPWHRVPAPPAAPFSPLVLRGVSQRETIRAHAARVIAVTALHYSSRPRD